MSDTPDIPDGAEPAEKRTVSRRRLLGMAGAGVVVAGAGVGGFALGRADADSGSDTSRPARRDVYPFYGAHQAGITTPAQDRLHFATFDVTTSSRAELVDLLQRWTAAAARMTQGQSAGPLGAVGGQPEAPPDDTGEALGLPPSGLTITVGFGRTLFEKDGRDRFGIRDKMPDRLVELPHFPADDLDPALTGGDLCVQACADDPQVAVHAVRNLARMAFGTAAVRWSQLGFGRTSSTSTAQATPRNLFGFKDGTANLKAEDPDKLAKHVWVGKSDDRSADWLADGSYLVARRINMRIEPWDRTSLVEQETIIGRAKGDGAPLSGGSEFTPIDFAKKGRDGRPVVDMKAHVRLAHPDQNDGVEILRRGYNFTDGTDGLGRLNAGLFFIAFVRDPVMQYIPMQNRLSRDDLMMEYLVHTGSALFAVPPGIRDASASFGSTLFG